MKRFQRSTDTTSVELLTSAVALVLCPMTEFSAGSAQTVVARGPVLSLFKLDSFAQLKQGASVLKAFLSLIPMLVGATSFGAFISGMYLPYSGYLAGVFTPVGIVTLLLYLDDKL